MDPVSGVISVQSAPPPDIGVHGGSRDDEGRIGMFVVETIARIRQAHFGQGKSIKAIFRELRVSRKTVRKVIRSEETDWRKRLYV